MINLGIIGFGGIAKSGVHMGQILKNPDFNVKAAADIVPNYEKAQEFGIKDFYTDYKDLLKDPEINAVLIATPHFLHAEQAIEAFNAGKHVLIEKPIARNLEEARNVMEAAKKSGKIGMIGFCQRFYAQHADIKKQIEEGKIGNVLSARIHHYQNFRPAPTSWWLDVEKTGGGAVIGSGIHRLDLLRWLIGEVKSVYAAGVTYAPRTRDGETCVHAVLEFESGAVANFSINWASFSFPDPEGLSISGEKGMILGQDLPWYPYQMGVVDIENGAMKEVESPACQTMYQHFADCINNNKTPCPSLEEGYKSLQLVRAIYKSMETKMPVVVADVDF